MAQRVEVQLVDDTDGSEGAVTVAFGLEGVSYEIDLSEENDTALRVSLAPYIKHARKTSTATARQRPSGKARRGRRADTKRAREWLIARGYGDGLKDRGRIPVLLHEKYLDALASGDGDPTPKAAKAQEPQEITVTLTEEAPPEAGPKKRATRKHTAKPAASVPEKV
jgi:hypothetical protein